MAAEPTNEYAKGWKAFSEQTAWSVQDFKTYTSPHFMVRLQDERDGVLVEYALAALEKAYEVLGRDLGQRPSTRVRIEIFPESWITLRASMSIASGCNPSSRLLAATTATISATTTVLIRATAP